MANDISERTVLAITGADRHAFLQGLVTNDVTRASSGLLYTALLTPQGKYLADFFMVERDAAILLDVASHLAESLMQRLTMYCLRADVDIVRTDIVVSRGIGDPPSGALSDPRHAALGWRSYGDTHTSDDTNWDAIRVAHCIPETGIELIPNETYILEAGFERLNGVDFKKGCFVGQEIVARMKHKTQLKKGLALVHVRGDADTGAEIQAGGKAMGTMLTRVGDDAIAFLRYDKATGDMTCDSATITRK